MSFFFQTINLVAINNLNSERFSATDGHRVLNLSEASSPHAHGLLYRRHRLSIEKRREDRNGVVVSFYLFFLGGGGPLLSAWGNFASWLYYPPFSLALKSSKYAAYARKSPSPIVPLKISLFYLFPPLAEQKYFPLDS